MSIQEYLDTFVILTQEEIDKLTKEERGYYQENLKNYRDTKNVIETAREEGFEIGRWEGLKDVQLETVKNGLLKGYSFEILSDITKFSIEEIQEIADSLNK